MSTNVADMAIKSFPGFTAFPARHCVTGSMRHVYQMMGRDVGEEMLLGLGAGVGFVYWHQKGQPPFLGGRANVGRPGEDGLESHAGRRTGVVVAATSTSSARKAQDRLVADLSAEVPAMLQVDMGLLPYFDFPGEYHFGGHVIGVVGFDPQSATVLVCDRDTGTHQVSLADLAAARGSTFQPFPPRHRAWAFDFAGQRPPTPDEVRTAIEEVATGMLQPPISNLGVAGIRKAARLVPGWPALLGAEPLRDACRNGFIMIDEVGGTGGGLFRYMYARFLDEAAAITGDLAFGEIGARLHAAGDGWQQVAALFDEAAGGEDPSPLLAEISAVLSLVADAEEGAWRDLLAASRR
ncbi:BtrH N-terminal domain-containing protein [Dactylosporangium sp. NPDC049140]|uniref:BtrH N-terminal domain-containing protein n=1 Tax=Dactylosporangium sp. NPDC049140 TaxID=3155647 RepID=UPI0033D97376